MATVIWFFDRLFVPRELEFGGFAVVPLSAADGALEGVAKSFAAHFGLIGEFTPLAVPEVDLVAIVYRDIGAASVDEALVSTGSRAVALASALAYRQFGRGRPLGACVSMGTGEYEVRYARADQRRITNLPFVPEQDELLNIMDAFIAHPQAKVLADLFSEACGDMNPSAAITRLWVVLEALAESFPGRKHDKVAAALSHVGIANQIANGRALTLRAYKIRNKLMHEGRLDDTGEAAQIREEFTHLVWFALRRAGFQAVDPTGTYLP